MMNQGQVPSYKGRVPIERTRNSLRATHTGGSPLVTTLAKLSGNFSELGNLQTTKIGVSTKFNFRAKRNISGLIAFLLLMLCNVSAKFGQDADYTLQDIGINIKRKFCVLARKNATVSDAITRQGPNTDDYGDYTFQKTTIEILGVTKKAHIIVKIGDKKRRIKAIKEDDGWETVLVLGQVEKFSQCNATNYRIKKCYGSINSSDYETFLDLIKNKIWYGSLKPTEESIRLMMKFRGNTDMMTLKLASSMKKMKKNESKNFKFSFNWNNGTFLKLTANAQVDSEGMIQSHHILGMYKFTGKSRIKLEENYLTITKVNTKRNRFKRKEERTGTVSKFFKRVTCWGARNILRSHTWTKNTTVVFGKVSSDPTVKKHESIGEKDWEMFKKSVGFLALTFGFGRTQSSGSMKTELIEAALTQAVLLHTRVFKNKQVQEAAAVEIARKENGQEKWENLRKHVQTIQMQKREEAAEKLDEARNHFRELKRRAKKAAADDEKTALPNSMQNPADPITPDKLTARSQQKHRRLNEVTVANRENRDSFNIDGQFADPNGSLEDILKGQADVINAKMDKNLSLITVTGAGFHLINGFVRQAKIDWKVGQTVDIVKPYKVTVDRVDGKVVRLITKKKDIETRKVKDLLAKGVIQSAEELKKDVEIFVEHFGSMAYIVEIDQENGTAVVNKHRTDMASYNSKNNEVVKMASKPVRKYIRPRGVMPEFVDIDTKATVRDIIEDIRNATAADYKLTIRETKKKQREFATGNFLKKRKEQAIHWLMNLTNKRPEQYLITVIRNIKQYNPDAKAPAVYLKPAWAAGLLAKWKLEGKSTKFIIDFGSGKAALTDINGLQHHNADYVGSDNELNVKGGGTVSISAYLDLVKKTVAAVGKKTGEKYTLKNVVARFTGQFHDIKKDVREDTSKESIAFNKALEVTKQRHKKYAEALDAKDIQMQHELLDINDESKYGSEHSLSIVAFYYPRVHNIMVIELGQGSYQGQWFSRISTPDCENCSNKCFATNGTCAGCSDWETLHKRDWETLHKSTVKRRPSTQPQKRNSITVTKKEVLSSGVPSTHAAPGQFKTKQQKSTAFSGAPELLSTTMKSMNSPDGSEPTPNVKSKTTKSTPVLKPKRKSQSNGGAKSVENLSIAEPAPVQNASPKKNVNQVSPPPPPKKFKVFAKGTEGEFKKLPVSQMEEFVKKNPEATVETGEGKSQLMSQFIKSQGKRRRRRLGSLEELLEMCRENGYDQ